MHHIRKQFQLVGVAQTTVDIGKGGLNESNKRIDFSVQIGGIAEIHNTGKEDIYAGDWIIWDVRSTVPEDIDNYHPQATKRAEGTTMTKVLPVIRPLRSYDIVTHDHITNYFNPDKINKFSHPPNAERQVEADKLANLNGLLADRESANYAPSSRNFAKSLVRFVAHILTVYRSWTKVISRENMDAFKDTGRNGNQRATSAQGVFTDIETLGKAIAPVFFNDNNRMRLIEAYRTYDLDNMQNLALFTLMEAFNPRMQGLSVAAAGAPPDEGNLKNYIAKNALKDLIMNMYQPFEDVLSRVVGKAVRSISPGQAGDVLLGAPYFV